MEHPLVNPGKNPLFFIASIVMSAVITVITVIAVIAVTAVPPVVMIASIAFMFTGSAFGFGQQYLTGEFQFSGLTVDIDEFNLDLIAFVEDFFHGIRGVSIRSQRYAGDLLVPGMISTKAPNWTMDLILPL